MRKKKIKTSKIHNPMKNRWGKRGDGEEKKGVGSVEGGG